MAPVSIGLGKANQLASSKTLAKPNLRADCVSAFEQAWRRVEDVVVAGIDEAKGFRSKIAGLAILAVPKLSSQVLIHA